MKGSLASSNTGIMAMVSPVVEPPTWAIDLVVFDEAGGELLGLGGIASRVVDDDLDLLAE